MTRQRNKSLDEAIKDLALTCVSATWVNMRRNKLFNAADLRADSSLLLLLAFAVQFVGLMFERWFFFAQANHPQNLYYQTI